MKVASNGNTNCLTREKKRSTETKSPRRKPKMPCRQRGRLTGYSWRTKNRRPKNSERKKLNSKTLTLHKW